MGNVSFLQFCVELHRHIVKLDFKLRIVIHLDVSIQQIFPSELTSKYRLLSRLKLLNSPDYWTTVAAEKKRAEA